MNRNCKNSFDVIIGGASAYRSAVGKVLTTYSEQEKRAREDARQYKNEDERIKTSLASLNATTQAKLTENRTAFCNEITSEVEGLKKELASLACERPNPAFVDMLHAFADFGIAPTKTQIESLMQMNAGNILGFSMLNNTLEKTGSSYRIESTNFSALEKDVDALAHLADLSERYIPIEHHSAGCSVYKDSAGSVELIGQRTAFESAVKSLDEMAKRWSDTAPSVRQLESYTDSTDATAAEQFISDRESAAASITQQRDGVAEARAIGRATAEANAKNATVMDIYTMR